MTLSRLKKTLHPDRPSPICTVQMTTLRPSLPFPKRPPSSGTHPSAASSANLMSVNVTVRLDSTPTETRWNCGRTSVNLNFWASWVRRLVWGKMEATRPYQAEVTLTCHATAVVIIGSLGFERFSKVGVRTLWNMCAVAG